MPQPQSSIVRIGLEALRVLFVLGVATWYYALPKFIERQEIGSKLGVVALLGSEGGRTSDGLTGRAFTSVRWSTGRGAYVAVLDQKTERLIEVEVESLQGWRELIAYVLVVMAAALLLHRVTGLLVGARRSR